MFVLKKPKTKRDWENKYISTTPASAWQKILLINNITRLISMKEIH